MKKTLTAIGLMSGTSCDGIDIAVIKTNGLKVEQVIAGEFLPYSSKLQKEIKSVISMQQPYYSLEKKLTILHAECVNGLISRIGYKNSSIDVIGFHGHTIFHEPNNFITHQIGDGSLLTSLTGINTVYNFRKRDMAEGGVGAPLVPIYHKLLFDQIFDYDTPFAVLNIGGVSNITYIYQNRLIAMDTGPGNALMNDYIQKNTDLAYDIQGEIAKKGIINYELVNQIMLDPYFNMSFPKSLDRNHFVQYSNLFVNMSFKEIIATLNYFTAKAIVKSFELLPKIPKHLIITGGGRYNATLLKNLSTLATKTSIEKIDKYGYDGNFIEAQAFACLAVRYLYNLPISFNETTGIKNNNAKCGVYCKY